MMNACRQGMWALLALFTLAAWPAQAQTVVEYIHTDALGSVVAVTDANRTVIERREYEPYGAQLAPAVQDGPGYTGHVQDAATGLVYMQQRYYDPMMGVFLSVDPVTAYDNPVVHFNRYRYSNNNPYTFTDPDGRATCADQNCRTAHIDSNPAQSSNINPLPSIQPQTSSPVQRESLFASDRGPTITFNNDTPGGASPNQPVTLETALMVEQAVVNSGVESVNVNSTTGGRHSPTSNHYAGSAVDINRVNGQRVDSAAAAPAVRSVQEAAAATQSIRENFGPAFNQKTQTLGGTARPVTAPGVVNAHKNHIHISGQR